MISWIRKQLGWRLCWELRKDEMRMSIEVDYGCRDWASRWVEKLVSEGWETMSSP